MSRGDSIAANSKAPIMMASRFFLVLILISCVMPFSLLAAQRKNSFAIDAGSYVTNIEQRLNAPAGFANKVSTITGYLRLRPSLSLGKGIYFEPSFGTLLPGLSGADGSTKTYLSHFDVAFSVPLFRWLSFRTGPGIQWGMLTSTQQDVSLNNGTSTSTFYTPGSTAHYFLITVQGGFCLRLVKHLGLNLEVYSSDVASRLRRRFDGAVTLSWIL